MKKRYVSILVVIGLLLLGKNYISRYYHANRASAEALELGLMNIDLDNIEDGTYEGEYTIRMVTAKVKIEVKDYKIKVIELLEHEHSNGHSGSAIIDDVLLSQSLDVEAVTGSTVSSKTILKAIETALNE